MAERPDTDVWLRLVAVAIDGQPVTVGAALHVLQPLVAPLPAWSLLLVGARRHAEQPDGISTVQARTASGRLFCGGMRLASGVLLRERQHRAPAGHRSPTPTRRGVGRARPANLA